MPAMSALRLRIKRPRRKAAGDAAAPRTEGDGLRSFIAENPCVLFRALRDDPFLIAKDFVLHGAAKVKADLLALDHQGSVTVVVCADKKTESLLTRGITAASIVAGWKADHFAERLCESSARKLTCFLHVPGSEINVSQRLVFVAERFDREILSAVRWLAQEGNLDVSCWKGRRVRTSQSPGPQFTLKQVFPTPKSAGSRDVTPLGRPRPLPPFPTRQFLGHLPRLLPARAWRSAGVAALALLLIFAGWSYNVVPQEAASRTEVPASAAPQATPLPSTISRQIRDAQTGAPVAGATVFYAGEVHTTNAGGDFKIELRNNDTTVLLKASGYRQTAYQITGSGQEAEAIELKPLEVRALYLSYDNLPNLERRDKVLGLIERTDSNAMVVGVKDASGYLSLAVDHELAQRTGAFDPLRTPDLTNMVKEWKQRGLYTIALVCLFKDGLIADSLPRLALRGLHSKTVIRDRYGVAWVDPSSAAVQDYNLAAAKAAAEAGFDEIQFDFVRYPAEAASREGLTKQENQRRLAVVTQFLTRARNLLAPYNVYLGGSVFGSVCSQRDVNMIGQDLKQFASLLDYVSPMLYPSYFGPQRRPATQMQDPYLVVHSSLRDAAGRLGESRILRPWLQNFPHETQPPRPLRADQIRAQVRAANDAQASGWMLWDGGNSYRNTFEALSPLARRERKAPLRAEADD